MLVIDMVYRYHSWTGCLVVSLHWNISWCLLLPWKLEDLWDLVLESIVLGLSLPPQALTKTTAMGGRFGSLLNSLGQEIKRGSDIGALLGCLRL